MHSRLPTISVCFQTVNLNKGEVIRSFELRSRRQHREPNKMAKTELFLSQALRNRRRPPTRPIFSPNTESFPRFIERFELYVNSLNDGVSDEAKRTWLPIHLADRELEVFQKLPNKKKSSYRTLVTSLTEFFDGEANRKLAALLLQEVRKRQCESVGKFATRLCQSFQSTVKGLNKPVSEVTLRDEFMKRLGQPLQTLTAARKPKTFHQAIQIARDYEGLIHMNPGAFRTNMVAMHDLCTQENSKLQWRLDELQQQLKQANDWNVRLKAELLKKTELPSERLINFESVTEDESHTESAGEQVPMPRVSQEIQTVTQKRFLGPCGDRWPLLYLQAVTFRFNGIVQDDPTLTALNDKTIEQSIIDSHTLDLEIALQRERRFRKRKLEE